MGKRQNVLLVIIAFAAIIVVAEITGIIVISIHTGQAVSIAESKQEALADISDALTLEMGKSTDLQNEISKQEQELKNQMSLKDTLQMECEDLREKTDALQGFAAEKEQELNSILDQIELLNSQLQN